MVRRASGSPRRHLSMMSSGQKVLGARAIDGVQPIEQVEQLGARPTWLDPTLLSPRGPPLCLGRVNAPASVIAIGQVEWAGSAARIERYVELSFLVVSADDPSRTIGLQRRQIDSE